MQPFGRVTEKVSPKTGAVNYNYHIPSGPPAGVQGDRCTQCDGKLHVSRRSLSALSCDRPSSRLAVSEIDYENSG